ncbi:unnamed protein product, partial [Ectocarpus sp. 12 AP-2014]
EPPDGGDRDVREDDGRDRHDHGGDLLCPGVPVGGQRLPRPIRVPSRNLRRFRAPGPAGDRDHAPDLC